MHDADAVFTEFRFRFLSFLNEASVYMPVTRGHEVNIELIHQGFKNQFTLVRGNRTFTHEAFWLTVACLIMSDQRFFYTEALREELATKLARKRVDYGWKNIVEFEEMGIIIRAVDKVHRIKNIEARDGFSAVGESVRDAYDDIVGYAAVAFLFLTNNWSDDTIAVVEPLMSIDLEITAG